MANRMKEDEKNEKIIRGLLKLPANRRCINCNSLGPQYVCTNFWTFVWTACSGMHREFTHRVKSISMATFTSQEVSALQAGGNERAKEIYMKEWDPQRHSLPDGSNVERLRDFIKHVYVDRRYSGERGSDRLSRVQGVRNDYNDNTRTDAYRGGSKSPPFEDSYERRNSDRAGPNGRNDHRNFQNNYNERSPGSDQEIRRYGEYRRSPGRFENMDDGHRDQRFGNGSTNRSEEQKFTDVASKSNGRSPDHYKVISSPPVVRPVREILGEDLPPLRVGEPSKAINGSNATNIPAYSQRTLSSSSLGSTEGNSIELQRADSGTLIDFSADSGPSLSVAPKDQLVSQPVPQETATVPPADGGNWASFDFVPQENAPQAPSSSEDVEALSKLAPGSTPAVSISALHITGDSLAASAGAQWPTMQQHQSLSSSIGSHSAPQQFTSDGGAFVNQTWGSFAPTAGPMNAPPFASQPSQAPPTPSFTYQPSQAPPITSQSPQIAILTSAEPSHVVSLTTQPSQFASLTAQPSGATSFRPGEMSSVGLLREAPEQKLSGRKELPADLFTATYSPLSVPFQTWQIGPPRGMGYSFNYPSALSIPTIPQSSKSSNPFELANEPSLVHSSSFPSMSSLQGALPNIGNPPTLMRASSFGSPPIPWVPPQAQAPSYPTGRPPNVYMMQQAPANATTFGHQVAGGFSSEGSLLSAGEDQLSQSLPKFPQAATPNYFSGGNPFG